MKKFLSILCLCAILLTACSSNNKKEEQTKVEEKQKEDNGTHEVVDHAGNTVKVPNKIKRIVIDQVPIVSTYVSFFNGKAPHIVGYAGDFKNTISETVLKNMAPEL